MPHGRQDVGPGQLLALGTLIGHSPQPVLSGNVPAGQALSKVVRKLENKGRTRGRQYRT